ncbi:S41 family peptidase [Flavobacterium terrae]|uniref:Carboxyl-terminal processing protease n=1 Tax=Flavobacterium terrae TaxID=415425 RepID=A0A1M6A999_9FLAO|nr:S41 family peptidase [Flavobacterium terrae]SHI33032.1 carboxyl-terminal processing protease [Flavobacterium terrae]
MKIDKVYFPIIIFSAIAVGFLLGGIFIKAPSSDRTSIQNETKQKLNKLIEFIDSEYVDNIDTDSIVDQTVTGILEKLDPHSVYIAKNEAQQVAEEMKGDFVGIGVNFFIENDSVIVINPVKNGPSEKAGIKSGDRILAADGEKLFGKKINTDKLYKKLKGEIGSKVSLTVYRKSEKRKFNTTVNRNTIPVKSVDIALMINKKIGYIKINRFAETTFKEFKSGLTKVIKQGAKELILDLRDNGGGYLEEAVAIADEFLPEKKLIVFTKNKKNRIDKTFATDYGSFENGKITVLINENTASASEIIAGAIQDNDRGLVIGRRSFGKGLVQRDMPFKDGSSVRLTIARYYTPTGRSIQKPYDHGGNEEYFNDFMNRYHNGEMYSKDSIKIADTLKFKTPKGRVVYGGGGIVPDVFVPLEASKGNEIVPLLMQSGVVTNYVFKEIDKNRKYFEKLNYTDLIKEITITDDYFFKFSDFIHRSDSFVDLNSNPTFVKRYLAAEFCRQLLGENQYYHVILKDDTMLKEALKH